MLRGCGGGASFFFSLGATARFCEGRLGALCRPASFALLQLRHSRAPFFFLDHTRTKGAQGAIAATPARPRCKPLFGSRHAILPAPLARKVGCPSALPKKTHKVRAHGENRHLRRHRPKKVARWPRTHAHCRVKVEWSCGQFSVLHRERVPYATAVQSIAWRRRDRALRIGRRRAKGKGSGDAASSARRYTLIVGRPFPLCGLWLLGAPVHAAISVVGKKKDRRPSTKSTKKKERRRGTD